ncbi:hypothetical protein C8Q75DRAFT_801965 [Abortiporus biennis]|nr:hypothetical protein C8Q75DRAFT_801965 [Abortiporus biennis]
MFFTPLFGAATLFAGFAAALPRPDSAIGGEVAVSAPNGIPLSDTAELASQLATTAAAAATGYNAGYGSAAMTTAAPAVITSAAYDTSYASATSSAAYASMTYGSGSSNWGSYDDCVQQCVASFGAPPAMYTPSATSGSSSGSGSSGSGVTHTVIVAPTQGVLRYVPFAVNASVGDTVHFVWNANNHTVTKSSQLEICNKTSDAPFASGTHDKDFTFDQVVNDTNPVFFYCGTPGHCQKGMFGIINPPSAATPDTNTSMANMMSSIMAANPDMSAMAAYTNSKAGSSQVANNWGGNIDLASLPDWSHSLIAENVLYNRAFMGSNPDVINTDGSINMNVNAPLAFPNDLSPSNNAAAGSSSAAPASATPTATDVSNNAASAAPASTGSANQTSGAGRTVAQSGVIAVAVIAASLLAL